jgi:SsrA-binding protein
MAKKSRSSKSKGAGHNPRISNRRAFHDYHIHDKLEVGIALRGSEVKSIRDGRVSLAEGYANVEPKSGELFLLNVEISHYPHAGLNQHEPKRQRKLLAHKRQIQDLMGKTTAKGITLIPLSLYFVRGMVKLEIGVATGKRDYDKRQDLKKRESQREIQRGMTRKRL